MSGPTGLYGEMACPKVKPSKRSRTVRAGEVRMIQQIESLGADHEAHMLPDVEVLVKRRVDIEVARAVERVPRQITKSRFAAGSDELRGLQARCVHRA